MLQSTATQIQELNLSQTGAYRRVSMLDMLDEKRAPEVLDVALGHRVADRVDRIESERAAAEHVDTAELVVVQAANDMHS